MDSFLLIASYVFLFNSLSLKPYFFAGTDPVLHALWGMEFYLLGILLFRLQPLFVRWGSFAFLISALSVILLEISDPDFLILMQVPLLCCVFAFALKFLNRNGVLIRINKYTMGIYLLHLPIIMNLTTKLFLHFASNGLAAYFGVTVSAFLISLGLASIVMRMPYGNALFGDFSYSIKPRPGIVYE